MSAAGAAVELAVSEPAVAPATPSAKTTATIRTGVASNPAQTAPFGVSFLFFTTTSLGGQNAASNDGSGESSLSLPEFLAVGHERPKQPSFLPSFVPCRSIV
jgi:hypothetical protein